MDKVCIFHCLVYLKITVETAYSPKRKLFGIGPDTNNLEENLIIVFPIGDLQQKQRLPADKTNMFQTSYINLQNKGIIWISYKLMLKIIICQNNALIFVMLILNTGLELAYKS